MALFMAQVIFMGIVATLVIDIWAVILSTIFKLPTTNWSMVGRWCAHLRTGQFIHRPISQSKPVKSEQTIGWLFHYIIGIGYAYLYVILMVFIVSNDPSLISAIIYGLVTLIAPWLVLQPALGLGLFARLADKPNTTGALNLSVHLIFEVALYFSWTLSLAFFNPMSLMVRVILNG